MYDNSKGLIRVERELFRLGVDAQGLVLVAVAFGICPTDPNLNPRYVSEWGGPYEI